MLVALLSVLEPAGEGASCPKGFLVVGGRTVIERQAGLAMAMGCERIVCLAEGLPPELVAVQHMVERAGLKFHAIRDRTALHALATASDQVLVIAAGVLPDRTLMQELVGDRMAVLSLPETEGLQAGYERLDRDRCWAGVARCSGAEIERLAELPRDIDPLAALMRSALQTGRPVVALPDGALMSGQWQRVDTAQRAAIVGKALLRQGFTTARWVAPGNALADRIVLGNADDFMRRPGQRAAILGTAVVGFGGATLAVQFGHLALALVVLAAGSIGLRAFATLRHLAGEPGERSPDRLWHWPTMVTDLLLLALFVQADRMFLAEGSPYPLAVLLLGLHLWRLVPNADVLAAGEERPALLILLALAVATGNPAPAIAVLSIIVLAVIFVTLRKDRLTGA